MSASRLCLSILVLSAQWSLIAQEPPRGQARASVGSAYVIERSHQTVRYEADGTGRATLSVRVRIQSDAALEAFGRLTFPYDSSNQRLDVDTVRVRKAGGGIVVTPASSMQDVNSPVASEAPVYSDLRARVVPVTGLRSGDTLEYHVTWTTHTPLAPGHFWLTAAFPPLAVTLDERLTVLVPRRVAVHVKTTGTADPRVTDEGALRRYEWRHALLAVDTALLTDPTRLTRRLRRATPTIQLSTFRTWADVGRWYAGLEREREAVTPAIQARADSLVQGRTTLRDSIAALYDHVSQEFRYVSLSFGVGRYQPHAAVDVMRNQYGDCKDKHTLLASLLRAIGVASSPVLISSDAEVDVDVPSPHHFDHLITHVVTGRDTLWLDATPEVAPFRALFSNLRDRVALVIPLAGEARLIRTPERAPWPEFFHTSVEGQIGAQGDLSASVRQSVRSDAEIHVRAMFRQIPAEQMGVVAPQMARAQGFGGTASGLTHDDPRATREPFGFGFRVEHPGALEWASNRAQLWLPVPPLAVPEADTTGSPDTLDLEVGEQQHTVRLELAPGVTAQAPAPAAFEADFGSYQAAYRVEGRWLFALRRLRITRRTLPPARIRELVALRRAVRDDVGQSVFLTRTGAPRAAGGDAAEWLETARRQFDEGDFRGAVRSFRRVLALEPRHADAWNDLGRALIELERPDSAAAALQRQIEIVPDHVYAHNNLGLALWRLGRHDEAAASFRRQVEIVTLDRWAHANLGRMSLELGRDSIAVEALERAAAATPDASDVYYDLGRARLRRGETDRALAAFDRAIALHPSPTILNNAAYQLALANAALDRAEVYVRRAIDSVYAVLRDLTLDDIGPFELAASGSLGSYWDTLGWILFQRGDRAGAERYVRAGWLLTFRAEIGDHLGQIQERLGRSQEALRTYALALNGPDSLPETRRRLETLAGGRARARQLVATHRLGRQQLRTVRVPRALRANAAGEVRLLFAPGGVVEVQVPDGPAILTRADSAIRAASYPVTFPDSADIRLSRNGLLSCATPRGDCTIVLFEGPVTMGVRAVRMDQLPPQLRRRP